MAESTPRAHIPYQAYKPKRHSRNYSNHLPSSVSPPSPPHFGETIQSHVPTAVPQVEKMGDDKNKVAEHTSPQTASSPKIVLAPPSPARMTNGLPSPPASNHSRESSESPIELSRTDDSPKTIQNPNQEGKRTIEFVNHSFQQPSTSASAPSTPPSPFISRSVITTPELGSSSLGASKFRHVPLRKAHAPNPSSPLALGRQDIDSRTSSIVSLPPTQRPLSSPVVSQNHAPPQPQLLTSSPIETPSPVISPNLTERPLPSLPQQESKTGRSSKSPAPDLPWSVTSPPVSKPSPTSSEISTRTGPDNTGPKSTTSRSTTPNRVPIPYRPGFQPKGVYRHRTDDFLALRKIKRDGAGEHGGMKRVERERLERRLEKLINLHFPIDPPAPRSSVNTGNSPKQRPNLNNNVQQMRRASSIFDLDTYRNLNVRDAGDLWKNMLKGSIAEDKVDTRALEQRITPWEEDSTVTKCPLCLASFHPLTNRRHHCRLCGRIVCSLPPKFPQRPVTCSLLFVVDSKTRKIEEVGEGVDYGVRRRRTVDSRKGEEVESEEEKFLKGVRICRECRPILLRQQYQQERLHTPTFVKLHEAFIMLEHEIEEALPQFQELLVALSHNDNPTKEASAARKRLLEAFAQYEALAKKIKQLPCPNGPGSSQDRIQTTILMRANLFLQKNMFPLRSLPKASRSKGKESASSSPTTGSLDSLALADALDQDSGIDPDSELAKALQPLLEQEALLESFIEEAKAQRKFEDVKSLKTNLQEIRREIDRLLGSADLESKSMKQKDGK